MRASLRIALIYASLAAVWILISDQILLLITSQEHVTQLQTFKGWFFVIFTSVTLYVFLDREFKRKEAIELEVRSLAQRLEERVDARTQELEQANKNLEDVNRQRMQLISNISHDLRTPITSLVIRSELLERTATPEQVRHIDLLKSYVANLRDLVEDILDISYLEDVDDAEMNEQTDFSLLIERAVTMNEPIAEATNVTVRTHIDESLPKIKGIGTYLDRIVTNLINNAVKYSPSATVDIHANYLADEHSIQFIVVDTGIGIPMEEQKQLFSRFYRGKTARKSGIAGTGLGLAIVKEMVDLHHGRIVLESTPGQGTKVEVSLPALDQVEMPS